MTDLSRRAFAIGGVTAAALATSGRTAFAATYPAKPVRFVVPVPPGGPTDIIARLVAERLQTKWGQPVVVENKAGASGLIANEEVAGATPDGHTVLIGNVSTNAITLAAYPDRKAATRVSAVTRLIDVPGILVANQQLKVTSVRQLIDGLKAKTLNVKYGSPGIGTYPHLDALMLMKKEGLKVVHIPYKGAAQIVPALLSNEIQIEFLNQSLATGYIRDGRLKALAVTTAQRLPDLPDVPTMAELGYAGIGTTAWHGMFVTGGTPPEIVAALHAATVEVLASPEIKAAAANQFLQVTPNASPAEFADLVNAEKAKWTTVLAENEIVLQQ